MQEVRALAGISSGPISFADLYGKDLYRCQFAYESYAILGYGDTVVYGNIASDMHQLTSRQKWLGNTDRILFTIKREQNEVDPTNFVSIKRVYGSEVEIYGRGEVRDSWDSPGFTAANFIMDYTRGSEKYLVFMIQKSKAKWNRLYLIDGQGKEYLINNFDSDYSNGRYYHESHSRWNNPNMISFFFWD